MNDVIYIGCDDSGYEMKLEIIEFLKKEGLCVIDCGSDDRPSRYPYYAAKVAAAVSAGKAERGILICGSGIGVSIAANKFKGVRAAAISDSYSARLTRRHNNSNILCLGGRMLGKWSALEIVKVWLNTEYDGGHHEASLKLLEELERVNMSGDMWCPQNLPYEEFEWNPDQTL